MAIFDLIEYQFFLFGSFLARAFVSLDIMSKASIALGISKPQVLELLIGQDLAHLSQLVGGRVISPIIVACHVVALNI